MSSLISKTDKEESITKCRKTPNPKVYSTNVNVLQEGGELEKYRRGIG